MPKARNIEDMTRRVLKLLVSGVAESSKKTYLESLKKFRVWLVETGQITEQKTPDESDCHIT